MKSYELEREKEREKVTNMLKRERERGRGIGIAGGCEGERVRAATEIAFPASRQKKTNALFYLFFFCELYEA